MNNIHKTILLCVAIITSFGLAMEKPSALSSLKTQDYYTVENLTLLKQKRAPITIPCSWIIDQENRDQPNDKKTIGTFLAQFIQSIEQAFFPIIMSHYLLTHFLALQNPIHPYHDAVKTTQLDQDNWHVYEITNTQFYLLVPKKYAFAFLDGFNINKMHNVSHLLSDPNALITHIAQTKSFPTFSTQQMKTIFNTKSKNRFNFMISGHGQRYTHIVNLEPAHLNALLDFFDKHLTVGVVFLDTCYLGGANLSLLDFKNQGIDVNHTFILIANSITDTPTYTSSPFKTFTRNFFNSAATLADKGQGLNQMINNAYTIGEKSASIHGTAQIPQIWLPRGIGFQTLNTQDEIFPLSETQLKIAEAENKPIRLLNKRAILIYPEIINQPLIINALDYKHPFIDSPHFDATPHLSELYDRNEQGFAETFDEKSEFFPTLKSRFDPVTSPGLAWLPVFSKFFQDGQSYLFPDFISMIRSNAKHHFARIELQNNMSQLGVLRFLSDSFLDIGERYSKKVFFIDELVGDNDINLLLESSRLEKKHFDQWPLEKIASAHTRDGKITLKNISITSKGEVSPHDNSFTLQFSIGNTRWELDSNQTIPWFFKDMSGTYASYRPLPQRNVQQKTLSQILQQKQIRAREKQKIATERKEAVEKAIKKWHD